MAIRVFVELKVFPMLSEQLVSAKEVAKRTQASELLLRKQTGKFKKTKNEEACIRLIESSSERLFRVLVASDFVEETSKGVYGPTKWTRHLSQRTTEGMVRFMYDGTPFCIEILSSNLLTQMTFWP